MKKVLFVLFLLPTLMFSQSEIIEKVDILIKQKNYQASENILKTALKNDASSTALREKLGDVFSHQKKWKDATETYKKLKQEYPEVATYHYKYGGALGMIALTQSKIKALFIIDEIKKAFIKTIELEPDHIDAHWALIESYVQIPGLVGGSKCKAFEVADKLFKLSEVDGYLAKGYIYQYKSGNKELAEINYKMAIEAGRSLSCFQKLTDFYEDENKPLKAIKNIEETNEIYNRNALHYQIGRVAAEYNVELDKGITCLNTFINNYSVADGVAIEWAYLRLAQIYRIKKNKEEAQKWVEKALMASVTSKYAAKEKELIEASL